ncbi:ArnT family glycosyltransferase [Paenalcaligenes sp. Me131]|uniref:ArnT family glycosyltransferase n=1 Tax=Paenalcaligenes sp. Me131 TaxID=3392636 RepID=UPI003D2C9A3A
MPHRSNGVPRTLWSLLLLTLCSQLLIMWALPYADSSEPRYAAIAQIMVQSNDWITPWFSPDVPFWGKPPLSFWAQALSFKVFGIHEFTGRLPSWLVNIAITALVMHGTRCIMPVPPHATRTESYTPLLAAVIYNTMCLAFSNAGAVLTDPYLNLGLSLSMVALLQQAAQPSTAWGWAFFVGLSIGMLSKGPLALVFCFAPLVLLAFFRRRFVLNLLGHLPWVSGILLFCALSLPWYILAELKTPGFLNYFLIGEHISRFLVPGWQGDLYGTAHQAPLGSIWLSLLPATFPWGLLSIFLLITAWRKQGLRALKALPSNRLYLLILALFPAIFFTAAGNILWTYLLPGLAPLAIVTAYYFPPLNRPIQRMVLALTALVPVAGLVLAGLSLHDVTLTKTDRPIAQEFLTRAAPSDTLYFVDKPSFSARFYTQERTASIDPAVFNSNHATAAPAFVVIANDNTQMLKTITDLRYTAIAHSKRYQLFMRSQP